MGLWFGSTIEVLSNNQQSGKIIYFIELAQGTNSLILLSRIGAENIFVDKDFQLKLIQG